MTCILVCGDRNWTDYKTIENVLKEFSVDSTVIHGGCSGADTVGGEVAKTLGMKVIIFPAEWKKYGKAAGPIRNKRMLDEGNPEVVIAFHNYIKQSRGTKNMVEQACKRGIDVILVENK